MVFLNAAVVVLLIFYSHIYGSKCLDAFKFSNSCISVHFERYTCVGLLLFELHGRRFHETPHKYHIHIQTLRGRLLLVCILMQQRLDGFTQTK